MVDRTLSAKMRIEQNASAISRFPTEILRLIFDDVVDAIVSNDAYLNYDAPRSGRDIMLQEAVYGRGQDLDRIVSVGNASPWSLVLRTRKRLVLVCWTWWAAGISSIYKCVYIHRIGQLPALVRTLEESALVSDPTRATNKRPEWEISQGGEVGYGRWIKHITMEFHLPYSWLDVYLTGIDRLLDRCLNLLSLVHQPICSPPLFKEPLSEAFMETLWNGSVPVDLCSDKHKRRHPLSSLNHLTIGARNLVTDSMASRIVETFKYLTSLELSLSREDKHFFRLQDKTDVAPLIFPCLRYFAIKFNRTAWYRAQLSCILERWCMPALTHFFALGDSWDVIQHGPLETPQGMTGEKKQLEFPDVRKICDAFGDKLQHLHFDARVCYDIAPLCLVVVFKLCPKLRSISFPCNVSTAIRRNIWGISHANIEVVTITPLPYRWAESHDREGFDSCTSIIREMSVRQNAPKLQAVRMAGVVVDDVPGRYFPEINVKNLGVDRSRVLRWANLLATRGVRLENQTKRRLVPSVRLLSDARLQDYAQVTTENILEHDDEDDTSDASYVEDAASDSVTTSFEDSDIGSDDALEHDHDGLMCTAGDQELESYEHAATLLWLEAKPVKDFSQVPLSQWQLERVSKDGGQISWDDALERFSESLRRDHEWEEEDEGGMYEADNDSDES